MTKAIDLADLSTQAACDKGFELELKHPASAEPLGVFIKVLGSDSAIYRDHMRKKGNSRLRQQFQNQRKGKDSDAPTFELIEKETIELLAAVTLGWRTGDEPTITHGGKKLQFSTDNARFLYAESWIRQQVDEAVGDLENFMPS